MTAHDLITTFNDLRRAPSPSNRFALLSQMSFIFIFCCTYLPTSYYSAPDLHPRLLDVDDFTYLVSIHSKRGFLTVAPPHIASDA